MPFRPALKNWDDMQEPEIEAKLANSFDDVKHGRTIGQDKLDNFVREKNKEDLVMNEYMKEFYKEEIEAGKIKTAIDAINVMIKKFKLTKDVAATAIDDMDLTADEREKVLAAL